MKSGVMGDGGLGGRHVTGSSDDELCRADDGMPLVVAPGARVEIAPDDTEMPWLQEYDALDSSNNITRTRETAFYSWYTAGNGFSAERTRIPTRNTFWFAPSIEGPVANWLIVRDGRGGASACQYTVLVRRPDAGG